MEGGGQEREDEEEIDFQLLSVNIFHSNKCKNVKYDVKEFV